MSLFDLAIIYIACGAPFAVFSLADPLESRGRRMLSAATALVLWPIVIVRPAQRLDLKSTEARADELAARIGTRYGETASVREFCEFRDVLARYCGLAGPGKAKASFREALELAEHPAPHLAAVCLQRRRRRIVDVHLAAARLDLVSQLRNASPDILEDSAQLAVLLRDDELTAILKTLTGNQGPASLSAAAA
ncbi:MAG TPA: hypothetical protein VL501_02040 [Pyrinomonadaceae bacterium]|nr:hypothetical protein [Pyrinomonadaceae bacterium]